MHSQVFPIQYSMRQTNSRNVFNFIVQSIAWFEIFARDFFLSLSLLVSLFFLRRQWNLSSGDAVNFESLSRVMFNLSWDFGTRRDKIDALDTYSNRMQSKDINSQTLVLFCFFWLHTHRIIWVSSFFLFFFLLLSHIFAYFQVYFSVCIDLFYGWSWAGGRHNKTNEMP